MLITVQASSCYVQRISIKAMITLLLKIIEFLLSDHIIVFSCVSAGGSFILFVTY